MPDLSIITINLNNSAGLCATIKSVLNQTYESIEYIVIDGGSTDGSVDIIRRYQKRISYWVTEADNGIYHAMNKGIINANGRYLLFLNSGDVLAEMDVIERIFKNNISEDIVYGDLIIKQNGKCGTHRFPDKVDFSYFLRGTIGHPCTLIKRDLFSQIGLYNERLRIVADWEFFVKSILLKNSTYRHLSIAVSVFSMDGTSSSARSIEIINTEKQEIIKNLYPRFVIDFYDYPELFKSKIASVYNFYSAWELTRFFLKGLTRVILSVGSLAKGFVKSLSILYRRSMERLIPTKYKDPKSIPVIINNYNRLTCLKLLVAWLERNGFRNIFIIDNCSTYPPLIKYYDTEYKYNIFRLNYNAGHLSLWDNKDIFSKFSRDYYIYTDPDVIPVEECPADFIEHFIDLLKKYPDICKVGFSLKIDDLPDKYSKKEEVIKWESQNYQNEMEPGVYKASIDTTFALYRPREKGDWRLMALRTGPPYQARHLPWYEDDSNPDEEDIFYLNSKLSSVGHWSK